MPDRKLKLVVETKGRVSVLHVSGSVDHLQYYLLEEAIQTQLDKKQLRLVVNLGELTYICSAGINTMGHAASQYEKLDGRLCYVKPANKAQRQFFTTIGVDRLFPWADTVEEALKQVDPPTA